MGYYDREHPVFLSARSEAAEAITAVLADRASLLIATAGDRLLIDADGPALGGPGAAALASRLFEAEVLAIQITPPVRPAEVGRLLELWAESPDRLIAAGGMAHRLAGASGLLAVPLDCRRLFAGEALDLPEAMAQDPVLRRALEALLRFRGGPGLQVEVRLADVATADDLGSFLEGLVGFEPEAAAEAGAKAYALHRAEVGPEGLAAAADTLSAALVRLAPDARFALLRKLSEDAAGDLIGRLPEAALVEAVAGSLAGAVDDPTVAAVGRLLARLHPLERDRKRLLSQVDRAVVRPVDGLVWQALEARTLEDERRGWLELTASDAEPGLMKSARRRMAFEGAPFDGQEILHARDDRASRRALAEVLAAVIEDGAPLDRGLFERIGEELDRLEADGDIEGVARLLTAAARRAATDPEFAPLLPTWAPSWGRQRFLLEAADLEPLTLGRVALLAMDGAPPNRRAALVAALSGIERWVHPKLLGELGEKPNPSKVEALLEAAVRRDEAKGVALCRAALAERPRAEKPAVLRLLARVGAAGVPALAHAAGWTGPGGASAALGHPDDVLELQVAAVAALGRCRSQQAAGVLARLLDRGGRGEAADAMRDAAARALTEHPSPEAREALRAAANSAHRAVRSAARRRLSEEQLR